MTLLKWLKCLRSDCWNHRITLCIMGLIGFTSISANSCCLYQALEVITCKQGEKEPEFPWTNIEQSLAKASYFIGFLASSIPGSLLADYIGGKAVFGIGCTCSGLGSVLTPTIIKSAGSNGIIALRIIVGAGEAMVTPAGLNLLSKWLPSSDRGLIVGVFLTAPQLGFIIGNLGSGYMLKAWNWIISFYIWGGICLAYCVVFFFLCYSEPRVHPFISDQELKFLVAKVPIVDESKRSYVVRHILTTFRVWCAIVSTLGFYWCFFSVVMDLAKYTHRILDFGVAERGAMMSIPFTLMYVTNLSSCYITDFILQKRVIRRRVMRKVCACLSSVPPAVIVVSAYYCGSCNPAATVCLFGLALVFMSFYYCGLQVNTRKLSPRNLSLVIAVINTFGAVAAFVAPIVHGSITARNEESEWHIVGWITSVLLASGIILYLFCGSAERYWWEEQANVDEYNFKKSVRIRLEDVENMDVTVEKSDESKTRRLGEGTAVSKEDEDDNEGTKLKGILKKTAEEQSASESFK